MRRGDGDPLLDDGDVASDEETEAAQALLALGQLGEAGGGGERPERSRDDPPAGSNELLVVQIEEPRVVVVPERPLFRSCPGQGDEGRVVHRPRPSLGQRAPHAFRREVGRLGPEAQARSVRATEDDLKPEPVGCGGLGLLEPVGREMGRVGEPRQQLTVGRDEHLAFENVRHGVEELERLPRRAREVSGRGSQGRRRSRHAAAALAHQLPPVSRARLRIVGPPLPSRLVCIGCPLPQFGMG